MVLVGQWQGGHFRAAGGDHTHQQSDDNENTHYTNYLFHRDKHPFYDLLNPYRFEHSMAKGRVPAVRMMCESCEDGGGMPAACACSPGRRSAVDRSSRLTYNRFDGDGIWAGAIG